MNIKKTKPIPNSCITLNAVWKIKVSIKKAWIDSM